MTEADNAICFQCGQDAAQTRRLNRLDDGRPCPVCADRLLMLLPPVLPAESAAVDAVDRNELSAELERELDVDGNDSEFDRPA